MTLKYPLELNEGQSDYMVFQAHQYRTNNAVAGQSQGNRGGVNGPAEGSPIVLYMPTTTPTVSNDQSWQGETAFAGPLGALKRDVAAGFVGGLNAIGENGSLDQEINSIADKARAIFESAKANSIPALKQGATSAIAGFVGTSGSNLMAMTRGQVYNPNVELLFQGPKMRGFAFNFIFIPKSPQETGIVNQIIKQFKMMSAASLADGGMLNVPYVWSVKYMTGADENPYMNQFMRCALTSIKVQANPNSDMHLTFNDGMPVTTAMSLSFQEVDIILRDDHEESISFQGY